MLMKIQYLQSVINMPLFAESHLNSFLNSILSPSFCLLPAHSVFIAPCQRIHPSCLPRTVQVCVSHLGRVINSFSFPLRSPVWMLHLCGHPIFFSTFVLTLHSSQKNYHTQFTCFHHQTISLAWNAVLILLPNHELSFKILLRTQSQDGTLIILPSTQSRELSAIM